jgi:hypothetical protein
MCPGKVTAQAGPTAIDLAISITTSHARDSGHLAALLCTTQAAQLQHPALPSCTTPVAALQTKLNLRRHALAWRISTASAATRQLWLLHRLGALSPCLRDAASLVISALLPHVLAISTISTSPVPQQAGTSCPSSLSIHAHPAPAPVIPHHAPHHTHIPPHQPVYFPSVSAARPFPLGIFRPSSKMSFLL